MKTLNETDELYNLIHDNEIIFTGTENQCYFKLQRYQSHSADWAMKYEGYKITKVETTK